MHFESPKIAKISDRRRRPCPEPYQIGSKKRGGTAGRGETVELISPDLHREDFDVLGETSSELFTGKMQESDNVHDLISLEKSIFRSEKSAS